MFIKKQKRKNGRIYLSVVHGYRENGKTKLKHVRSLGYLDELEKVYDDPIAHFQAEIDRANQQRTESRPQHAVIAFDEHIPQHPHAPLELGVAYVLSYLHNRLDIGTFFETRRNAWPTAANPCKLFEYLVWQSLIIDHIADVQSKDRQEAYPLATGFSNKDFQATFAFLAAASKDLVHHMQNALLPQYAKTADEPLRYGVTSLYFKKPVSSDSDKSLNRLVHIGVLTDNGGNPIAYEYVDNKTADALISDRMFAALRESFPARSILVTADRGASLRADIKTCMAHAMNFVFAQSPRWASDELVEWMLDETDYEGNDVLRTKSRIVEQASTPEKTANSYRFKEVAFWNSRLLEQHQSELARVFEAMLHSPVGNENLAYAALSRPRFLQSERRKWDYDESLGGLRCLISNDTALPTWYMMDSYRGLMILRGAFRQKPATVGREPANIPWDNYLAVHCLISFVALSVVLLMQSDLGWRHRPHEIAQALYAIKGHHINSELVLVDYRDPITDGLGRATGVDLTHRIRTKQEVNELMRNARKGPAKM